MKYIIDFDSTFTRVEALDLLCEIIFDDAKKRDVILKKITEITNKAMEGLMPFEEALSSRISLLQGHKSHLDVLIKELKERVSKSFVRNKGFLLKNSEDIYLVSNGFKEFIEPVVLDYGIKPSHIFANQFLFDDEGYITGYDENNALAKEGGKVKVLRDLNLTGEVAVIGDGYNDYTIRAAGLATHFYAFTENIERSSAVHNADHVTPSFDEFLFVNNLPMTISYPKNRIKVLLLEGIHPSAEKFFQDEGYQVEVLSHALDEEQLAEKIKGVFILGIRSKTNVTKKVLDSADKLMLIGTFCIGTNQVDLQECSKKGIAVFNAPYSNTRSVVELAIGEIIILMRNILDKQRDLHQGQWNKSAHQSYEIRGKKLGIIGYGNIGAQLSILAEAIGMDVYFYDVVDKLALGNTTKCSSLKEILSISDVVSLHIDGRDENKGFFGEKEFALMKQGTVFINLSRGSVVDINSLVKHIRSGKIRGAGVDVFPEEPKSNADPFTSDLQNLSNVLLTPHIGGSTLEAQENIAEYVPGKLVDYVNTGNTFSSVNFPNVQLPTFKDAHRLLHIHKNESGVLAKINNVFSNHSINIVGQYLKTNNEIGYVITDIAKEYDDQIVQELKKVEGTIKFRVLY